MRDVFYSKTNRKWNNIYVYYSCWCLFCIVPPSCFVISLKYSYNYSCCHSNCMCLATTPGFCTCSPIFPERQYICFLLYYSTTVKMLSFLQQLQSLRWSKIAEEVSDFKFTASFLNNPKMRPVLSFTLLYYLLKL